MKKLSNKVDKFIDDNPMSAFLLVWFSGFPLCYSLFAALLFGGSWINSIT